MAGEKFAKIIREGAKRAIPQNELTDIVVGEVKKTSPLLISVENRFEISGDFLILSPFVKELKSKDGAILWEGLKVGERVNMLRVSKGQQFYILDRKD
ncbi:MAG: DUF2577 domain-containing protein [Clostridium sp.]